MKYGNTHLLTQLSGPLSREIFIHDTPIHYRTEISTLSFVSYTKTLLNLLNTANTSVSLFYKKFNKITFYGL